MTVSPRKIWAFFDGPFVGYFVGREELGAFVAEYIRTDLVPQLNWTDEQCRAFAQGYDREDAAQRGEADPWNLDDPSDAGDSDTWISERISCVRAGLSMIEPEDLA